MSSPENTALIAEARAWAKDAARVGRNIVRDVDSGILLARRLADALEAAGATQPEPEYEYTSADYDGTPNNQSFYVYGSVPARIAKYRRVKAGDWEPVPNQTGETDGRS